MTTRTYCQILLVEAKGLPATDDDGLADPYVELCYTTKSGKKLEKSGKKKSTLTPEWNEVFSFPIGDISTDELQLVLKDYDLIGRDDFMCESKPLKLGEHLDGVDPYHIMDEWIQLFNEEDEEQGSVRIKFSLDDLTDASLGKSGKDRAKGLLLFKKSAEKVAKGGTFISRLPSLGFSKKDKPKNEPKERDPSPQKTPKERDPSPKSDAGGSNLAGTTTEERKTVETASSPKETLSAEPEMKMAKSASLPGYKVDTDLPEKDKKELPTPPEYVETPKKKSTPKGSKLFRSKSKEASTSSPEVLPHDPPKHNETPQKPKWISDDSVDVCMICPTKFSMFKRKHHCRSCGFVVCNNCSSHNQEFGGEMARVCDVCYDSTKEHGKGNPLGRAFGAVRGGVIGGLTKVTSMVPIVGRKPEEEWEYDTDGDGFKEYRAQLPWWLYLLKPFSKEGTKLPIGSLHIKVIKGLNLPAMDMFGTSDPFCEVYLTQPEGDKKKQRTDKDMRTLNPQWDAQFNFRVNTTLCSIRVDVFDYDATSDNDFIGFVEIPLAELSHQTKVSKEFYLQLSDDAKLKYAKVKREKSKKNKQLQSETGIYFDKKARIQLELMYKFSKVGEFASHFVYVPPEPKPEPEFDMDMFYNAAMDLMELLGPVFAFLGEVNVVLGWTDPFKSCCVLIPFILCCFNPWLTPIVIQLWLIRYMFWQFVLVQWRTQEDEPKQKSEKDDESKEEFYDSDEDENEAQKEAKRIEEKRKKERESHMNGLLVGMANSTMAGAGMKETLQWLQNLIIWINGMIRMVYGLFQWKNPSISKGIFMALCGAFLYSCFFPFRYITLIGGVYVICMNTVPLQMLYWVLMGLIFYLTRAKASIQERATSAINKQFEERGRVAAKED